MSERESAEGLGKTDLREYLNEATSLFEIWIIRYNDVLCIYRLTAFQKASIEEGLTHVKGLLEAVNRLDIDKPNQNFDKLRDEIGYALRRGEEIYCDNKIPWLFARMHDPRNFK